LFHTGKAWLCAPCLTLDEPGQDVMTKMASRSIQSEQKKSDSKRARAAGKIEEAVACDNQSQWHGQSVTTLWDNATHQIRESVILNGEAVPRSAGHLKDTLADPDLAAIESSETRGRLLHLNNVVALGVDVANTALASNTHEKLISHQVALAHKVAMEQANQALHERDPTIEIKRLQVAARMINIAQQGVLTLQKLKTGGTQNVVVQHVHVASGGQALVGVVQTSLNDS
jgi:hypothetical protein